MTTLARVTYGLIEGPAQGWHGPGPVAVLMVGVVAAGLFMSVESKSTAPPVHRDEPRDLRGLGALGGVLFLLPVVQQVVGRDPPLASEVALLPLTVVMLPLSSTSGRLVSRIGPRL